MAIDEESTEQTYVLYAASAGFNGGNFAKIEINDQ